MPNYVAALIHRNAKVGERFWPKIVKFMVPTHSIYLSLIRFLNILKVKLILNILLKIKT